jgi:hypothetical protein
MYSLKTLLCITRTQPEKNLDDEVHISIYTDPNMNYALNKPTTSSTFVYSSDRAVDGNSNTNWLANGCFETQAYITDVQWWRVDFQEEIQVARVVITNRGNITYLNIIFISGGRVLGVNPRTTTDIRPYSKSSLTLTFNEWRFNLSFS